MWLFPRLGPSKSAGVFAVVLALLAVPAAASPPSNIRAILSHIRSVRGDSVLDLMESCGINVTEGSSFERYIEYPGDNRRRNILKIYFLITKPELRVLVNGPSRGQRFYYTSWVIDGETATPQDQWSTYFQRKMNDYLGQYIAAGCKF
jgi:hypothetical protein